MLVVKIEMWPLGDESKKRLLGIAAIANDGTGDPNTGNYNYNVKGKNGFPLKEGEGRLIGFKRKRYNAWQLLKSILEQVYP